MNNTPEFPQLDDMKLVVQQVFIEYRRRTDYLTKADPNGVSTYKLIKTVLNDAVNGKAQCTWADDRPYQSGVEIKLNDMVLKVFN